MKIIVHYAGQTYESEPTSKFSTEESAEDMYEKLSGLAVLQLHLKGGGFLILGPGAIKNCAILILESE